MILVRQIERKQKKNVWSGNRPNRSGEKMNAWKLRRDGKPNREESRKSKKFPGGRKHIGKLMRRRKKCCLLNVQKPKKP